MTRSDTALSSGGAGREGGEPAGHGTLGIRVRRVVGAGVGVIALSLLALCVPVAAYAFALAFQVRGTPDQAAINALAAALSPMLFPWFARVMTPALAYWAVRRTEAAPASDGLFVGVVAGLLGSGVTLAFGGSLTGRSAVSFIVLVALGWLGGLVSTKVPLRHRGRGEEGEK